MRKLGLGVFTAALLAACPSTVTDTDAPRVVRNVPARDASGIATNARVSIEFNEAMDAASISADTVQLRLGSTAVSGVVTWVDSEKRAELQPSTMLSENSEYTVTVTTGVKDVAGNALAADFSFRFITVGNAPHVSATTPADAAMGVARDVVVKFQFDKALAEASLTANLTLVDDQSVPVAAVTSWDGSSYTASISPSAPLAEGKRYTATAKAGITGTNGLMLPADKVISFTVVSDPPVVVSTVPADLAMNVALSTALTAHFSEPIDAASLSATTFFVREGSTMLDAALALDAARTTATLTPAAALLEGRTYTVTLTTGVRDDFGTPLATAKSWSFSTLTTVPAVTAVVPANAATAISGNAAVKVTFSEVMDEAKVTSATAFEVKSGTSAIAGTRSWDDATRTATFQPTGAFPGGAVISVHLSTAVTDPSGIPLAQAFDSQFTVSNAPSVSSSAPSPNDVGVPLGQAVSLSFSTMMDPASLVAANVWVEDAAGTKLPATYTAASTGLTLAPSAMLRESSVYTVVVTPAVRSSTGVAFAAEYRFSFTTSGVPPVVVSTTPGDGAGGVSVSSTVSVDFGEPMATATFTPATFTLSDGANELPGAVTALGDHTLVFTPSAKLRPQHTFTGTVTSGVTDVAGNALAAPFRFSFTTEGVPHLVSALPANGASGVALDAKVVLAFDENISSTIRVTGTAASTTEAVTLTNAAGARVDGAVGYDATTFTAVIRPQSAGANIPWVASTRYTVTVDGSKLLDSNGNAVGGRTVFSFVTGTVSDSTPPTLTSSDPGNGATGVSRTAALWGQLSEPLSAASVSAATVRVLDGTTALPGQVSYDAATRRVQFSPAAPLPPAKVLSFEIGAVTDLSGNAKAALNAIGFTTADNAAPGIAASAPANLAAGVNVNSAVRIAFTEAVDPSTLTVTSSAGPGAVWYDAASASALFVPASPLPGGMTVTVTVAAGLSDLERKVTAADLSFSFDTIASSAQDVVAPTASQTVPANAATSVSALQAVTVRFSEPMRPATIPGSYTFRRHNGPNVLHRAAFSASGDQLVLTPLDPLQGGVTYDLVLGTGMRDLAGNALVQTASSFTVESVKPSVSSTSPLASSTVGSGVQVSVVFSEALDPASIDPSTFTVSTAAGALLGAVSYDAASRTALFQPARPLADGTHTVTLQANNVRDLAGNTLTATSGTSYAFTFTVSSVGPSVAMANPCGSQIDADDFGTQQVTVRFDRPVRRSGGAGLDGTALKLQRNGSDQAVTVMHTADTDTAVLLPTSALLPGETYTVTATTLVLATNNSAPMSSPYACTFTTQRVVFQDGVNDTATTGYTLTGSGGNVWQRINSGDDQRSSIVWRGGAGSDGQSYARECTSGLQGAASDRVVTVEKQIDLTGYTSAEVRFQVMDDIARTGIADEGRLIVNDGADHVIKVYTGQNAGNAYVRDGKGSGNLNAYVNKTVTVKWQLLIKGYSAGVLGNCNSSPAGRKGLFVDDVLIVGQ
ncbi:MAG: Ig-like domain-containing protein [Archangiaceae bacterium]|nr:Ig-like domain-containing protein [Archangiaceae bacterium]